MPLEIVTEGIVGGIARFFVWVIMEVIFEILIRGLGYLICRLFRKNTATPVSSALVGLGAWIFIGVMLYLLVLLF